MTTQLKLEEVPADVVDDDDDEIPMEELDQVVGGLDRGWWPDVGDSSGPSLVP